MRRPSIPKTQAAHKAAGGLRKRLTKAIHHEESAQKEYQGFEKKAAKFDEKHGTNKKARIAPVIREIKHDEAIHEHALKDIEHELP
jgi:hypothetical protein